MKQAAVIQQIERLLELSHALHNAAARQDFAVVEIHQESISLIVTKLGDDYLEQIKGSPALKQQVKSAMTQALELINSARATAGAARDDAANQAANEARKRLIQSAYLSK